MKIREGGNHPRNKNENEQSDNYPPKKNISMIKKIAGILMLSAAASASAEEDNHDAHAEALESMRANNVPGMAKKTTPEELGKIKATQVLSQVRVVDDSEQTKRANSKRREEIAEAIANSTDGRDQYGLNDYIINALKEQGISINIEGDNPHIDTSNVYEAVKDGEGKVISGRGKEISLKGKYLYYAVRNNDGVTTIFVVDPKTGEMTKRMFSVNEWDQEQIDAYKRQISGTR